MSKLSLVRKSPKVPVKICYLAEVPEAVPKLVKLYQEEWVLHYGPDGPGIAESDIWDCYQIHSMPLALVAIDENEEVIGTGSLDTKLDGFEHPSGPWITSLIVEKNKRRNGIGTALIAALEMEARRFRSSYIYMATDNTESILLRRGWEILNEVSSMWGAATIYRAKL